MTSQIFANIYLNEFDRFVAHRLRPLAYMRYGDDFILFVPTYIEAKTMRARAIDFLKNELVLSVHASNDIVVKAKHGIHFLGVDIYPFGRKLKERMWRKIRAQLGRKNYASYAGLVRLHGDRKKVRERKWRGLALLDDAMM